MIIALVILSGIIGGFIAAAKGKNVFLWFVLCTLLPLIGHLILAFSGSNQKSLQGESRISAPDTVTKESAYNSAKWAALIKYDPDIASAVEKVRALHPDLEGELASSYLALGDKGYLPSILAKLEATAAEMESKKQEALRTGAFPIKEGETYGFKWRKLHNGDLEARVKGEWTKIPRLEFLQTLGPSDAY